MDAKDVAFEFIICVIAETNIAQHLRFNATRAETVNAVRSRLKLPNNVQAGASTGKRLLRPT